LREGLHGAEEAAKLAALRSAVQTGLDDIERGAFKAFADFDELGLFLKALVKDAIAAAPQTGK